MLRIEHLTCHYGVIRALNDVTITVGDEGIYAVVGANGAGKTTLINSIVGLVRPTSGSIQYQGEELTVLPPHEIIKRGIALCPEGRKIFKTVTVLENLYAGAYTLKDKKIIQDNIESVFELFPRIKERQKQVAGTLSGGEQQMLAIGRALMSNPKLLLLDEPSMGLAPFVVDLVFETIEKIHLERKIPSLVIEQNSEMALSIAKYAYVFEVGSLTLEGTGADLLQSEEVKRKYLGA